MDTEIFKDEARYRVQVKSWCLADEIIIFSFLLSTDSLIFFPV